MAGTAPLVLVAGGALDPNLRALVAALEHAGVEALPLLITPDQSPRVSWHLASGQLLVDGRAIQPTAAFLRHDVFGAGGQSSGNYRAFAWYTCVAGWLATARRVRVANRAALHTQLNKPHVLALARAAGLLIPTTLVSNEIAHIDEQLGADAVVKPVTGGGYCQRLAALRDTTASRQGAAAAPCIAQEQLIPPEVRVYQIGEETLAFQVISDELDYRTSNKTHVVPLAQPLDEGLIVGLKQLMAGLDLQFGAADFKTHPATGELIFLELNTAPMFSAFNAASNGALCGALIGWLVATT